MKGVGEGLFGFGWGTLDKWSGKSKQESGGVEWWKKRGRQIDK